MPTCFYYKDGTQINDEKTLIEMFFKENFQLKNAAIYSSAELQKSTEQVLRKLIGSTDYEASEKQTTTSFIVSDKNTVLFNRLGIIAGKTGRLAPEYISDERIYSFVLSNLKSIQDLPDLMDVTNVTFNEENLKKLKLREGLESVSDNKLIYLLSKIEDIMLHEQKVTKFGVLLHKIIAAKVQEKKYSNILQSFISDPENAEIIGTFSSNEWIEKIESITNNIFQKVKAIGIPISEITIMTDGKTPVDEFSTGLRGKLDLVAIDTTGTAHIFEIKISKTKYSDWDTAKQLTLDWQLAMYRQLLGQHVDVDSTMLITIPIWIDTLGNPNRIQLEEFVDRKVASKSGLNTVGKLTTVANKLIPRKIIGDYDPEREALLQDKLHKLLGEEYKVETGIEDYDVQKIMDGAKRRYEKEKKWIKWNNFDDVPDLKKGYIEADTEEEFEKKIRLYVEHVKSLVNRNVSILKDAIISSIKTGSAVSMNSNDPRKSAIVNNLLIEYLNDDWEVVSSIPEALAFGLVLLKNRINGNVNVISLSINQVYANSHLEQKTFGDLEYMKSYLFLNEFKDTLFPGQSIGKIGQIVIYNPISSQVFAPDSFSKFKMFSDLMHQKNMSDILKLTSDNVSGIQDTALEVLETNLRKYKGSDKEYIDKVFQNFRDTDLNTIDLDQLLIIQKELYESSAFSGYKDRTFKDGINFDDPKEILFALLQVAIASKNDMSMSGDFQRMSKFSLGFSDFKSLVAALYTDTPEHYDKEGRKIQGLVQGLLWTTPDWVSSKDLKTINKIMSTANQHIGEKMVSVSEVIYGLTKKFNKGVNFNPVNRNVIGDTQAVHKSLWATEKDGSVSKEFKTKNPYLEDQDNILDEEHSSYLKNMLFQINIWKLEIPDSDVEKINPLNLSSLLANASIREAYESGEYFRMPLVRREELSRFKDFFTTPGKLWAEKIKPYLNEFNDYIDSRQLTKEDLNIIERQHLGFYEMYDAYGRQTADYVAKAIEAHSVNYFEWNLDTIAHRIAFSKIRKKIFDKKLPVINAYVWWMKLLAGKENEDISNQLQYIADQLGLSVFDQPIIDKEFKDYAKTAAVVKAISTAGMLAFRPAALIKEMTIGAFKGISLAATQIYGKDQFTIKDLASAYKKLMTIDNKFSAEFNLIDRLNHHYRFANMDTNTIAQKLQSDRRGLLRGTGRYMYMCNTIPDYYNRLSIFLAKMIHDGSYEAHSLQNDIFVYDPTKDGRFSYYFNNRKNHMQDDKYISAKNDSKFNEQRRKYLLLINQLNSEYGENKFSEEGKLINKAYSNLERISMKSFTDMAYGYYDKDAQSQANNTWWGMTWLQFMQFWPGKMKMWFAKPIDEQHRDESPMGKVTQDYRMVDGQKHLLYHKTIETEDGEIKTEIVEEDTGDPVLKWEGAPYEGLFYSVIGTLRDVALLRFDKVKGNEERNRRALFALTDAGLIFLMLALMKALIDGIISENGTEGLSGTALNMISAINKKVLNEYNVWQSTLGAVNSEPVFLSWGKKISSDTWDAITGDKELMEVMTRNIGAAEVFKW